jgi:hypothetical protein
MSEIMKTQLKSRILSYVKIETTNKVVSGQL